MLLPPFTEFRMRTREQPLVTAHAQHESADDVHAFDYERTVLLLCVRMKR